MGLDPGASVGHGYQCEASNRPITVDRDHQVDESNEDNDGATIVSCHP